MGHAIDLWGCGHLCTKNGEHISFPGSWSTASLVWPYNDMTVFYYLAHFVFYFFYSPSITSMITWTIVSTENITVLWPGRYWTRWNWISIDPTFLQCHGSNTPTSIIVQIMAGFIRTKKNLNYKINYTRLFVDHEPGNGHEPSFFRVSLSW